MTDGVEVAERDPLDLELGIENLMRVAAQYDDEEADARAARFAGSLATTFQDARRIALGSSSIGTSAQSFRTHALNVTAAIRTPARRSCAASSCASSSV